VLSNAPAVGLQPDWSQTPFHLAQLLAPALSVSGSAPGCIYTWPGYRRPQPPALQLYTFPGDGAQGATSQYLYVFGFGGGTSRGRITAASLTGPDGPVRVTVIDNHTPGAEGYLPPGGYLSPAEPLSGDAAYTAEVTFTADEGPSATRRWTFTTGEPGALTADPLSGGEAGGENETGTASPLPSGRTPRVSLRLRASGHGARAALSGKGVAVGLRVRVTVKRRDCRCAARRKSYRLTRKPRRIRAGGRPVTVTVRVPSFFSGATPYRALTITRRLS
jgi:hypothetical protein